MIFVCFATLFSNERMKTERFKNMLLKSWHMHFALILYCLVTGYICFSLYGRHLYLFEISKKLSLTFWLLLNWNTRKQLGAFQFASHIKVMFNMFFIINIIMLYKKSHFIEFSFESIEVEAKTIGISYKPCNKYSYFFFRWCAIEDPHTSLFSYGLMTNSL